MSNNLLKSKTLNSSIDLLPLKSKSFINVSDQTKDYSNALENIEMEYIKNLQQQVYFLELECNYLRQQLKTDRSLRSSTSVSVANDNIFNALDDIKKKFQKDKDFLIEENLNLKREKTELESRLQQANHEFEQTRTNLDKHHHEIRQSKMSLNLMEKQMDQHRKDNLRLRNEITEAREQLNNRDLLIKQYQTQINDHVQQNMHDLRSSLNDMTVKLSLKNESVEKLQDEKNQLLKDVSICKQQIDDLKHENQQLHNNLENVLKQNETDLILAKKNANLMKSNVDQLEYSLGEQKHLNNTLQAQYNALLEDKSRLHDSQLNLLRNKIDTLDANLDLEKSNNKHLKSQLDQELSKTSRQLESKQNEISLLQKELNDTKQYLNKKIDENQFLSDKLKEYDRLKQIEEHIKLQRWEEFGTIAETMKFLTRSMTNELNK